MSCLPSDALTHFEQREQELLAINRELERKRAQVVAEAASAVQGIQSAGSLSAAPTPQGAHTPLASSLRMMAPGPAEEATGGTPPAPYIEVPVEPLPRSRPPTAPGTPLGGGGGLAGGQHNAAGEAVSTTLKFQSSRIAALQEELERTRRALAERDGEVQELSTENKGLKEDVAKLQRTNSSLEKKTEELKAKSSTAEARVKDLERETTDFNREKSQMEVQLRRAEADASAKEARLNRLTEECEKQKMALKEVGSVSKDQTAHDRREVDRLQSEVQKLGRQRSELVNAFKKQMKLIEVLKRQRAHMEAARVLSFTEDEFIRVLELGDRLGEK